MKIRHAFNGWASLVLLALFVMRPVDAQTHCYTCSYGSNCSGAQCKIQMMGDSPICPVDGKTAQDHFVYALERDRGQTIATSEMWRVSCTRYQSLSSAQDGLSKQPGYAQRYGWQLSLVSLPSVNNAIGGAQSAERKSLSSVDDAKNEQYAVDLRTACVSEIEALARELQGYGTPKGVALEEVDKYFLIPALKGTRSQIDSYLKSAPRRQRNIDHVWYCMASRRLAQIDGKIKLGVAKPARSSDKKSSNSTSSKKKYQEMSKCIAIVNNAAYGARAVENNCGNPISFSYCYENGGESTIFDCKPDASGNYAQGSNDIGTGKRGVLPQSRSDMTIRIMACEKGGIPRITDFKPGRKDTFGECR